MAEQDRYGSHWSAGATGSASSPKSNVSETLEKAPRGSGAEQDRYGGWFGGKAPSAEQIKEKLPKTSGAEQDRYGGWFEGKAPSFREVSDRMPQTSGAEQDRYGGWFGGKTASASGISEHLPRTSGAEQDRYASHFEGKLPSATEITDRLPQTSGAEQDRYGRWFGGKSTPIDKLGEGLPRTSGAEQDRLGSHFAKRPINPVNATAVGLLQTAILPSFGFHAGLSAVAYGVARYADRADGKDWLWPAGITANAWWSAVGTRVIYDGLSFGEAWSTLSYPQKLLLTGVSAWGVRLFYRIARRSVQRGTDDPRYTVAKKDPGFWNRAFFSMFIPEAVAQTLITLPFTLPFRAGMECALASPMVDNAHIFRGLAVFMFSAGYALEFLADAQLASHKKKSSDLNREGVWSIVRHPNYLGDALVHASFPVLLLSAGVLHPITILGPVVNYLFLRFVGGDRENEANQEERYVRENQLKAKQLEDYKREKNSFWPSINEAQNKWTWVVMVAGFGGVIVERGVRAMLRG